MFLGYVRVTVTTNVTRASPDCVMRLCLEEEEYRGQGDVSDITVLTFSPKNLS